jgi:hypothetical protein
VAYTTEDFNSKKALKEAVKAGKRVEVYAPGMGSVPMNGTCSVEGPHFPKPHTWYGTATIKDGLVVKVT